jgi:ribokinase
MIDLVAIGDVNADLLLQVQRFPQIDDEVQVDQYIRTPGGDAANIAVAAAKLGLNSAILGCVGMDEEGRFLSEALQKAGVEAKWLQRTVENKTGLVIGTVREDGQRNLLTYRGANNQRHISPELHYRINHAEFVHISDPLTREVEELATILCQKIKGSITLDPGSITAERGVESLIPLLSLCNICFLNEYELTFLTGESVPGKAIEIISRYSSGIIVVKRGEKGCLIVDHDQRTEVSGFSVDVVDTTGAGDAFDAGFLYALHNHYPLYEAARFANAVGALTTRALGAQTSQPTLQEVEKLLGE